MQKVFDEGQNKIVVDCEKLTYISSAGLGVFMGFIEELRENGGDLKICGLIPKVKQIFDMLAFHEIYDICDDIPQAKELYSRSRAMEG